MFGLSKKKSESFRAPAPPEQGVPTDRVVSLSSRGYSEPQIIKSLREEGYSPLQVDRAMKDALRTGASGPRMQQPRYQGPPARGPMPLPPAPGPAMPRPVSVAQPSAPYDYPQMPKEKYAPTVWDGGDEDMEEDIDMDDIPKERRIGPEAAMERFDDDIDQEEPPQRAGPPRPFAEPVPRARDEGFGSRDRRRRELEELTEEITDEKWKDMMGRVQSLEDRVERLSDSVKSSSTQGGGASSQEMDAVRREVESQRHAVDDTNARLDSLEEVMKGSLSPMIESVRKFSSAVKTAKQPSYPPAQPQRAPQGPPAPPMRRTIRGME